VKSFWFLGACGEYHQALGLGKTIPAPEVNLSIGSIHTL
jgi:hypothetical protein